MISLDFFTTLWLACLVCGLFALGGLLIAPTLGGAAVSVRRLTIANAGMFFALLSRILLGSNVDNLQFALFWTLWIVSNAAMVSALRHGIGPIVHESGLLVLIVAGATLLLAAALMFDGPQPTAIVACLCMTAVSITGVRTALQIKSSVLRRAKACVAGSFALGAIGALAHLPLRVLDAFAGKADIAQTPLTYVLLLGVWLTLNIGMMQMLYLRLAERAGDLAHVDELTGLLNRRGLGVKMSERRRHGGLVMQGAIVMIDIDHFKRINDSYGHATGDEVLRWFCDNLRRFMRHEDLLVRLGGEEFCLVMPSCSLDEGMTVAQRMCAQFASGATLSLDGAQLRVTASFGVAALGAEGARLKQDLQRADEALYGAKRAGRNRVQAWSAALVSAPHPFGAGESSSLAV